MDFTEEQTEIIENLAGLNYTVKQIAMYLDVDHRKLQQEFDDVESTFRYHYNRGKLIAQADIDMKLQDAAKGSNLTAMQQYEKIRIARHFENMRDKLVYGDS